MSYYVNWHYVFYFNRTKLHKKLLKYRGDKMSIIEQ